MRCWTLTHDEYLGAGRPSGPGIEIPQVRYGGGEEEEAVEALAYRNVCGGARLFTSATKLSPAFFVFYPAESQLARLERA